MSIDANDLVEGLMDEQARRNTALVDQPDVNAVVEDLYATYPVETIGMQADTLTTTVTTLTHKWDDNQTAWNFWSWDT